MRLWFLVLVDRVRDSMWFLPSVLSCLAFAVAILLIGIDRAVDIERTSWGPIFSTSPDSARLILSTMVGALVTSVGIVFSLTMLALAQTSSQYGPRLIRSFMQAHLSQATLAFFLATILYCLVVLRTIRNDNEYGDAFTPQVAVFVGEICTAACVIMLIAFVNYVASMLRAESVVTSVAADIQSAVDRLFPDLAKQRRTGPKSQISKQEFAVPIDAVVVTSPHTGYLEAINITDLAEKLRQADCKLVLSCRPGQFLNEGQSVGRIISDSGQKAEPQIGNCFLFGPRRTTREDVECAVLDLVEVAIRALSPGINDPMTAVVCIDYLGNCMGSLASREPAEEIVYDRRDSARILTNPVTFDTVLASAFDQIRQYGGNSVAVIIRLLKNLEWIATCCRSKVNLQAVSIQLEMIQYAAERQIEIPSDLSDIRTYLESAQIAVEHRSRILDEAEVDQE